MAFVSSHTTVANTRSSSSVNQSDSQNSSNKDFDSIELEFLLRVLGNADLKGNQVEMFYNMIIKLQNMYLEKSKK